MFSRLASRGVIGSTGLLSRFPQQLTLVAQATTVPATSTNRWTPADPESPKRDLVNFPRPTLIDSSPPIRHAFIPEAWFEALYKKTGVTGPYMFGITFATFLCSKEYFVFDHEFITGSAMVIVLATIHTQFGQQIKDYLTKEAKEANDTIDSYQENAKEVLKATIQNAEDNIKWNEGSLLIFDVKKENVKLQQEAAYRERLLHAYKEVKRRLDYQIEKQNVERQIAQKNLVDWVVRNVVSSITPDQEKSALKQCISDLNGLAVKT